MPRLAGPIIPISGSLRHLAKKRGRYESGLKAEGRMPMRAARHGSAWLIGCGLNLTETLMDGPCRGAVKKTLASPQPRPKNRDEAGVLPGPRGCPRQGG